MKRIAVLLAALSFAGAFSCGKTDSSSSSQITETTSAEAASSTTSAVTTTAVSTTSDASATSVTTASATVAIQTTQPLQSASFAAVTTVQQATDAAPVETQNGKSVEVYSAATASEIWDGEASELLEPDKTVDTSDIGAHEVTLACKRGDKTENVKVMYQVVDTEKPMILNGGWSTCHVVNTPFDLSDYVGFADNYDRHPTLTYTGTVDTNALGDYPITATVTDSSGNSESWDLTITVAESKPSPQDNNPRVSFRDFTEKYAGEGRRFGIDVSTWQGNVDFNAVKADGCSFVVIRLGYYYSKPVLDDYFRQNLENAKAAGLDVGVYLYTADNTEEGVREHARWIAEELGDTKLELPVAFDWEEFTNFQQYGMSIHDLNQLYLAFADELSKHGLKCMLYSSKNFLNNFWYESTKAAHPVWLAHFVDETDYAGKYAIWQASCYGKINGITGDVDMNILYEPLPLE